LINFLGESMELPQCGDSIFNPQLFLKVFSDEMGSGSVGGVGGVKNKKGNNESDLFVDFAMKWYQKTNGNGNGNEKMKSKQQQQQQQKQQRQQKSKNNSNNIFNGLSSIPDDE